MEIILEEAPEGLRTRSVGVVLKEVLWSFYRIYIWNYLYSSINNLKLQITASFPAASFVFTGVLRREHPDGLFQVLVREASGRLHRLHLPGPHDPGVGGKNLLLFPFSSSSLSFKMKDANVGNLDTFPLTFAALNATCLVLNLPQS